MARYALLLLLMISASASAIVIRDDIKDADYRLAASEVPALADMPGEGHGVLIAPQWVVTAAHVLPEHSGVSDISIGGICRKVEKLFVHPGFKKLPQDLIDPALRSGDATAVIAHLASSDDIALIKLVEPVTDIAPLKIHRGKMLGKTIRIVGKGATGTGSEGIDPHASHRTELRHAFNKIVSAEGRWLSYRFDPPAKALPLEGMSGSGDSGGPLLVAAGKRWQVVGLTAWTRGDDNAIIRRPGLYGHSGYAVRLAHYRDWIEATMATDTKVAATGP